MDKRLLKNFDYQLLIIALILCFYGLVVISSATQGLHVSDTFAYVRRQAIWVAVGMGGLLLAASIDYINYYRWSWYLYSCNIIFLVLVLFVGRDAGGSFRWINLGFFDFQPSELAKLIVIISLARLLVDLQNRLPSLIRSLPLLLLFIIPPILLIFMQPDLGTALVFIVLYFAMLFMAGVPLVNLILMACAGLATIPLFWSRLLDYQKMRLLVFLNPELDPLSYGYQLSQSMIAIGSGGVGGKGLFEGTQAHLQFLPEQHTDFIFSVLGEELGFLGAVLLLFLYFLLIYRILKIGSFSKDRFGALLCLGVAALIAFQVMVNIGMSLGIMPVTGLPLPFMSYGGSAMIVNMASLGVVLSVGMRRFKIQF